MACRPTRRDTLLLLLGAATIIFFTHVLAPIQSQETIFGINNPLVGPYSDDLAADPPPPPPPKAETKPEPVSSPPPPAEKPAAFNVAPGSRTALPLTRIVNHAPGWTIFENLYMSKGTLFIMTDEDRDDFPAIRLMTSTGLEANGEPGNEQAREPTKDNMDFLTPYEARERWTGGVWGVEGTTWLFNDPQQFLAHYYHGCAELILGAWSFYAGTYDSNITERGVTTVPPITRAIFSHASHNWRDGSHFNTYFMYSAFPSIAIEEEENWADRTFMTRNGNKAWVFERVMLADRSAAFRGKYCGSQTQRTVSEAFEAVKEKASKWWWEPVRRSVLHFAGVPDETLDLALRFNKAPTGGVGITQQQPIVITYISRQGTNRRRLLAPDHAGLVKALETLCTKRGYELHVVDAGKLSQEEQLALAAKTTVMIGVHGNGLTHLLLMAPTPLATVIEIFYPQGFAHDYEWTTRALGMKHFAVWNDTYYAFPEEPRVNYPDPGFQGDQIPVHGESVAQLIADRLDGKLP